MGQELPRIRCLIIVDFFHSSATGPEDAYQIANASFQMHCGQTKTASVNGHENVASVVPMLIAVPPSKSSDEQTAESSGDDDGNETKPSEVAPVKIYDEETNIRLLVCSEASRPVGFWYTECYNEVMRQLPEVLVGV